jgi:hypothetical protein
MPCQYDDSFISHYLNGELDIPSKKAFEHHIKLCPDCQATLEAMPKKAPDIVDEPIKSESVSLDLIKKLRKRANPGRAKKAAPKPVLPPYMVFLKKYGIPILSAVVLITILAIPQISNPIWGGLWSGAKKETPVISDTIDHTESLVFSSSTVISDQAQLVEMLNAKGMGASPWQVLYTDEEKAFIRNNYYVVGFKDEGLYLAADLDSLGLNRVEGLAVTGISFSPTGHYMLAGNPALDDESKDETTGVYLFNMQNGMYAKVTSLSLNKLAFAWSPDGRFLAFSRRNDTTGIQVFDTQTRELHLLETNANQVKSIFITSSGKLSVYTGSSVMSASIDNPVWTTVDYAIEPFYIDPETGTAWFISDGTIKGQIPGYEATQSLDLAAADTEAATGFKITGSRVTGGFLVFLMENGNAGALNLQAMTAKLFDLDGVIAADNLPWLQITKEGTHMILVQEGSLIISNGPQTSALKIPGLASLSPDQLKWADEENLVYVRLLNLDTPKAGELAIMKINVVTGETSALLKTAHEENPPEATAPVVRDDSTDHGSEISDNTVYEKSKATGNWVESLVIEASEVRNGPSDRYNVTDQLTKGEILLFNDKQVSGWYLAKRVSGGKSPKEFWIPAKSILTYNKNTLPAGIITDETVKVGSITLVKGNLIRIIRVDGDRSYCIVDTIDVNAGITGWIDNGSYTKNTSGVYLTQAYLRSGSILYMEASAFSQEVEGYADFTSVDQFVNLSDQRQNGFIYVSAPGGGLSGWVQEEDLFVPGQAGASEPKGYDLDGDGIKDNISLETDGITYTLTVNYATATGSGEQIQGQYKVVDIVPGDSLLEIVIEEYGPSDDYMSTFYRYNGETLIPMGKIQGLCGNNKAVKGNGTVLGQSRGSILETWYFQDEYTVNNQSQLIRAPKDFYHKLNYAQASPLKLKTPFLPFAKSPGSTEIAFTLNQGEEVRFVGSDNIKWCLFETTDGRRGWLEISGFWDIAGTGITAGDVFEGLVLAD